MAKLLGLLLVLISVHVSAHNSYQIPPSGAPRQDYNAVPIRRQGLLGCFCPEVSSSFQNKLMGLLHREHTAVLLQQLTVLSLSKSLQRSMRHLLPLVVKNLDAL